MDENYEHLVLQQHNELECNASDIDTPDDEAIEFENDMDSEFPKKTVMNLTDKNRNRADQDGNSADQDTNSVDQNVNSADQNVNSADQDINSAGQNKNSAESRQKQY